MILLGKMRTGISRSRQPDVQWGDTFVQGWANFRAWQNMVIAPGQVFYLRPGEQVHAFGRSATITRQSLINDDLGMFSDFMARAGAQARNIVDDHILNILKGEAE